MRARPSLVAHADWSGSRRGRAVVLAEPLRAGRGWRLGLVEPERLPELFSTAGALIGLDAPLGLPRAYAAARSIAGFRAFLAGLSAEDPLFEPAARPAEVSLARPFYPLRPAGARRAHLLAGHGVASLEALSRSCDRLAGASCLFWTVGPAQCGRAALAIWRALLPPMLDRVRLWPFDGPLAELLGGTRAVVAETYPGLAMRLLDLPRVAKSRAPDRARLAEPLSALARGLGARFDPALEAELLAGFPRWRDHGFDALLGCLLLLAIVEGRLASSDPVPEAALPVEGWILGLVAP